MDRVNLNPGTSSAETWNREIHEVRESDGGWGNPTHLRKLWRGKIPNFHLRGKIGSPKVLVEFYLLFTFLYHNPSLWREREESNWRSQNNPGNGAKQCKMVQIGVAREAQGRKTWKGVVLEKVRDKVSRR
jgi:hypothetical protein